MLLFLPRSPTLFVSSLCRYINTLLRRTLHKIPRKITCLLASPDYHHPRLPFCGRLVSSSSLHYRSLYTILITSTCPVFQHTIRSWHPVREENAVVLHFGINYCSCAGHCSLNDHPLSIFRLLYIQSPTSEYAESSLYNRFSICSYLAVSIISIYGLRPNRYGNGIVSQLQMAIKHLLATPSWTVFEINTCSRRWRLLEWALVHVLPPQYKVTAGHFFITSLLMHGLHLYILTDCPLSPPPPFTTQSK